MPLSGLAKPGRVLMLRHAQAPGIGDPPGFRIGDCTTQRNLDAGGRAQAARIGQRLAEAGLTLLRFTHAQVRYERDEVERTLRAVVSRLTTE